MKIKSFFEWTYAKRNAVNKSKTEPILSWIKKKKIYIICRYLYTHNVIAITLGDEEQLLISYLNERIAVEVWQNGFGWNYNGRYKNYGIFLILIPYHYIILYAYVTFMRNSKVLRKKNISI